MARRTHLARILGALVLSTLLALAGCGGSATATGGSPTPTATLAPTSTPAPITTCAQLPGFAGAAALAVPQTEFPTGTVSKPVVTSGGGAGQFTINEYDGCTPNNTTDLIVSSGKGPEPFAHLVLFYGWGTGSTFPGDGQVQHDCAGAPCFYQDDQHYLSLDQVTDHGNGVITFRLREALPPPAPSCDPSVFTSAQYQTFEDQGNGVHIPLPPMSRVGMGQGAAGSTYIPVCSAGTPASVQAFLNVALPAYGWSANPSVANSWTKSAGGLTYSFDVQPLTSAQNWTLRIHRPM